MKTHKQNRKKWIAALRSGEYEQGVKQLCRKTEQGYEYCCLGVLCEVLGVKKQHAKNLIRYKGYRYSLPVEAMKAVGMNTQDGQFIDKEGETFTLVEMNDFNEFNMSFDKIADLIESEPRGMFNDS